MPSEILDNKSLYCVISLANFCLLFNLQLIRSSTARGSGSSVLSLWSLQKLTSKEDLFPLPAVRKGLLEAEETEPGNEVGFGTPGVRFSKDPKTSRARRLFGALFG